MPTVSVAIVMCPIVSYCLPQIKYHADFEKEKGKYTVVSDDPEMRRVLANQQQMSLVAILISLAQCLIFISRHIMAVKFSHFQNLLFNLFNSIFIRHCVVF